MDLFASDEEGLEAAMAIDYAPFRRWLGFGVKTGGQLLVAGVESVTAYMVNIGTGETFDLQIISSRWGLGLGGSRGVVAVLGFGIVVPDEWNGRSLNDWSFNVALTESLISKSAIEALHSAKHFLNLYKGEHAARSANHRERAFKDIGYFEQIRNGLNATFARMETIKGRGLVVLDLPLLGAHFELSDAFVTRGTIYVSNATDTGSGY
jgi:hypothetical protein